MNRIEKRMQELQQRGEKALITYITAGLPDMEGTKRLIRAQEEAGVDVVELGIPFSDPVADGPVIQDASYRSILKGTTLRKVLAMVKELRAEGCEQPLIFMMYYNTVMSYGVQNFADACVEIGIDGLIIPDLPMEEQGELKEALAGREETVIIPLVSPVSGDRIPKLVSDAKGFVYCVSSMGVTGNGGQFHAHVAEYLKQVKAVSPIPVMMGFGIRTAADVLPVKDVIDGAIVGSHFIQLMEESGYDTEKAKEYIRTFKTELNA